MLGADDREAQDGRDRRNPEIGHEPGAGAGASRRMRPISDVPTSAEELGAGGAGQLGTMGNTRSAAASPP
jgi:hypothetical protein